MELLAWIEQTAFSTWIREEWWVFPVILSIHAIGMGLSAGTAAAIALRILGVAKQVPLSAMQRFYRLIWVGVIANIISGLLLLIAYPAKALTNPLFYCKLVCLVLALSVNQWLLQRVLRTTSYDSGSLPCRLKATACLSVLLWIAVIGTGRFLAYTNTVMLATWLVPG